MQEFFALAKKTLAEQMDLRPEDIKMDTLFEDIEADSIDIVEMIMVLEDTYDIEFPEEDLENYPTVGSLLSALYDYLQKVKG
ncbi:MAG: acyl carrier protein [Syntrophomonadaceae bacterium]|nr:acyl carrier protein [Syntrophomonadaceae bacterium]